MIDGDFMQMQKTLDGGEIEIEERLRPLSFYSMYGYARDEDVIEMPYMIQTVRLFGGRPKTETKLTDYGIEV